MTAISISGPGGAGDVEVRDQGHALLKRVARDLASEFDKETSI
jgi:hypothetical protein